MFGLLVQKKLLSEQVVNPPSIILVLIYTFIQNKTGLLKEKQMAQNQPKV